MKKISLLIMSSLIIPIAFSSISAKAEITSNVNTKIKVPSNWTGNNHASGLMPRTHQLFGGQAADVPILDLRYYDNGDSGYKDSVDVHAVNEQIASLGANGIVLISGDVTFSDSLIIGDNQTLLGSGSLQIKLISGNPAIYRQLTYIRTMPAVIRNSANSSVIKVGSNTHISGVITKGGLEGISHLNDSTNNTSISNVSIDHVDISGATGDGIKLDNIDGLSISNSAIHDLSICEDNAACEFSVLSPTVAPNAAISAIGSRNITIDNVDIDSVTYGIFLTNGLLTSDSLANDYDPNTSIYKATTSNVTINNTNIRNSRREGLLLVGSDGVTTNNLTIDNRQQVQNMDLVVLQGSRDITMNNTHLFGGINGLMIVNSATLPNVNDNNIVIKDMTISSPSRSGVFINPAATIGLENVTINNPKIAGLSLFGNEFGNEGLGAAVENMTLTNVQVNYPAKAAIAFSGPIKNINGDVTTTQTEIACVNPSNSGQLEQDADNILTINGEVLADLEDCY